MSTWDHIEPGDRVEFETRSDKHPPRMQGTVLSVWHVGQRPNLDIEAGPGDVWVRAASDVIFVERPS